MIADAGEHLPRRGHPVRGQPGEMRRDGRPRLLGALRLHGLLLHHDRLRTCTTSSGLPVSRANRAAASTMAGPAVRADRHDHPRHARLRRLADHGQRSRGDRLLLRPLLRLRARGRWRWAVRRAGRWPSSRTAASPPPSPTERPATFCWWTRNRCPGSSPGVRWRSCATARSERGMTMGATACGRGPPFLGFSGTRAR